MKLTKHMKTNADLAAACGGMRCVGDARPDKTFWNALWSCRSRVSRTPRPAKPGRPGQRLSDGASAFMCFMNFMVKALGKQSLAAE